MGEYKVMALEVLKGQRRPEEARDILTRVAKQVCLRVDVCVCVGGWVGKGDVVVEDGVGRSVE